MKAIETVWDGYRFRSRLEARWAKALKELKIKFVYEPEGYQFEDGTTYLPDFYLPDSKQYLEIKGVMSEKDEHKIEQLMKAGESVVVGYDNFEFAVSNYWLNGDESEAEYFIDEKERSYLVHCDKCDKYFFTIAVDTGCPNCGKRIDYDTICWHYLCGDEENRSQCEQLCFMRAIEAFKSARFEHGENETHKARKKNEWHNIAALHNTGRQEKTKEIELDDEEYKLALREAVETLKSDYLKRKGGEKRV